MILVYEIHSKLLVDFKPKVKANRLSRFAGAFTNEIFGCVWSLFSSKSFSNVQRTQFSEAKLSMVIQEWRTNENFEGITKKRCKLFVVQRFVSGSAGYPDPQQIPRASIEESLVVFATIDAALTIGNNESAFLRTVTRMCGKRPESILW